MMRTILDVQPRVAYGGAGGVKSSDEVVDDLASSILEKIEKYEFDWKQANHVIFKKDERGRWKVFKLACENLLCSSK